MRRRDFLAGLGVAWAAGDAAQAAVAVRLPPARGLHDLCSLGFRHRGDVAHPGGIVSLAHPFAAGLVRPDTSLHIAGSPAQMDVGATHPDGSVRHALLAARLPPLRPGEMLATTIALAPPVQTVAETPGSEPPLTCDVVVTLTPQGAAPVTLDVGAAFRTGPVDRWRSGKLVAEGRVRIPAPALAEDFELVCDLACHADATPPRLDIGFCRERTHFTRQAAKPPVAPDIAYEVTVTDRGRNVYQDSVSRHSRAQNWHHVLGEVPVHVVFDIHALRVSGAVIHDPSLGVARGTLDAFVIRPAPPLTPFHVGGIHAINGLTLYMGQTGDRPDIGPETMPVACWLITQEAKVAEYCLWQAEGASSIPWHWWDAATGSYGFVSDYPDLWPGWPGHTGPDAQTTGGGWFVDVSHQPDASFVPWLLTGRRKFLDDLLAQAVTSVNWFNPAYRQKDKGLICQYPDAPYQQQVRGQAWSLRQIAQAAAFAPDRERLKAPLTQVTRSNLAGLRAISDTIPEGELRYWVTSRPATWEQDYMASSLATADALGFEDAWPVLQNMMGFLAGIMLSPDFYPKDCCAYTLPISLETKTWLEARDGFIAQKAKYPGSANHSGMGVDWAGNTFRPYYSARRGTLSYAAHKGDAKAQKALRWFLANVGSGPSVGATDAGWQLDPTFAIG
jgi:hypothetical protein